jgi:hypothetical protein
MADVPINLRQVPGFRLGHSVSAGPAHQSLDPACPNKGPSGESMMLGLNRKHQSVEGCGTLASDSLGTIPRFFPRDDGYSLRFQASLPEFVGDAPGAFLFHGVALVCRPRRRSLTAPHLHGLPLSIRRVGERHDPETRRFGFEELASYSLPSPARSRAELEQGRGIATATFHPWPARPPTRPCLHNK